MSRVTWDLDEMASESRGERWEGKETNLLGIDKDLVGVRRLVVGLVDAGEEEEREQGREGREEGQPNGRRRRWEMGKGIVRAHTLVTEAGMLRD